jgi:hypothetical protein
MMPLMVSEELPTEDALNGFIGVTDGRCQLPHMSFDLLINQQSKNIFAYFNFDGVFHQ